MCIRDSGNSALVAFRDYKPDLVLLDLMLPGIDGYEVCREIRKTSKTPIIMLSAKTEVFDKVLGLELGADDYMIKPFDSKELVARVKAILRRYTAVSYTHRLSISSSSFSRTCSSCLHLQPTEISLCPRQSTS